MTITAKYHHGVFEPSEPVPFEEGEEVEIEISVKKETNKKGLSHVWEKADKLHDPNSKPVDWVKLINEEQD